MHPRVAWSRRFDGPAHPSRVPAPASGQSPRSDPGRNQFHLAVLTNTDAGLRGFDFATADVLPCFDVFCHRMNST